MVSALDSGSSYPGAAARTGRGHCAVFLGKTLYSHSASPALRAWTVDSVIHLLKNQALDYKWVPVNCQGNMAKIQGLYLGWTSIPSRYRSMQYS